MPIFDWMERSLPRPSLSGGGLGALAAYGFGLLLVLPAVTSVGFLAQQETLPLLLYALLAMPLGAYLLAHANGRFERLSDLRGRWPLLAAALAVLALPVALGIALDVRAVSDIFEADF